MRFINGTLVKFVSAFERALVGYMSIRGGVRKRPHAKFTKVGAEMYKLGSSFLYKFDTV